MRIEALLDDAGFARVEEAIRRAESRTSGEIVFAIVERSGAYVGPRCLLAAALAFGAGIACLVSPLSPALWLPGLQALAFAAGYAGSAHPAVLRAILLREWRRERVSRAAGLAFLEQGVANTRERTGILIYVSLLEQEVAVLADRGIASRVEAGTWDRVVEHILGGVRQQRAEHGLEQAVQLCGEILAAHFPPRADNPNELADRIRV